MAALGLGHHKVWRSEPQHLIAAELSTPALASIVLKWIEKCTGNVQSGKSFVEYLGDGTALCELIQHLVPGMIRKVNKIRSPFAWRENISFFLSACSKLGLGQGQLFSPDDLITTTSSSISNIHKAKGTLPGSEQSIRQICATICYLALELASRPDYAGPCLELEQQIVPSLQHLPDRKNSAPLAGIATPSSPDLTSVTSSSSSSTVQSPSGPRTRRVESVTHLITETSCTDIQSYAELVLYLNGSNKEYTTVAQPGSIRLTQSFNRPYNSKNSRVHRTLSDRTPFLSKLPNNILQDSVSDNDIHTSGLQRQFSSIFKEGTGRSWDTFEDFPDDSTTTPSDASTVICREVSSSRCSSNPQTTSEENHITERGQVTEAEVLEPLIPGYLDVSRDNDCSKLAREVEVLKQTSSVTPESNIESEIARILSVDLNGSELKVQSEQGDSGTRLEVSVTAKSTPESSTSLERRTAPDLNSVELSLTLNSRQPTRPLKTVSVETSSPSSTTTDRITHHTLNPSPTTASPRLCVTFAERTAEQVTDIHDKERTASERNFSSAASNFESCARLDKDTKRTMDTYVHAQHGNGHVTDTEPVSLNGIKTRGYPSNCQAKDVGPTSNGVPHHSLSLTSSDPESPSSCQVMENFNGESRGQSSNFDLAPLITPKFRSLSHLGGLDISRVQSDALPQSALPSMIICGGNTSTDGAEHRGAPPRFLSDAQSIDANSIEDVDGFTIEDMRRSTTPKLLESPAREPSGVNDSNEVAQVKEVHQTQQGRPSSAPQRCAPQRSSSASAITQRSTAAALVSPSHSVGNGQEAVVEKRKSIDYVRQKRSANIQESTRAALAYSSNFKVGKSDSLPREDRETSITYSAGSAGSDVGEESLTEGPSGATTSTATVSSVTSPSSASGGSVGATPFNLRNLTIDQTKEASVNQMYEIWKEVEAGGAQVDSTGNTFFPAHSPISPPSPVPVPDQDQVDTGTKDPDHDLVDTGTKVGCNGETSPTQLSSNSEVLERQVSEVLQMTDISISLVDPVCQSTPFQTPQTTPSQPHQTSQNSSVLGRATTTPSLLSTSGGLESGKKRSRPNSFSNKHIDSLLDTLKSLSRQEEDEDLKMLEDMLKSNTFQEAKHVHDDMLSLLSGSVQPSLRRIVPRTQMMREHMHHHTQPSPEVDELRELLRSPNVQSLLFCHDKVSTHDLFVPDAQFHRTAHDPVDIILSPSVDNFLVMSTPQRHAVSSRDVPSNRKEGATIVCLERTNRPLGCTIYKQGDAVFIGKLLKGCDAEASDKLREGDELLEVNGIAVAGKRTEDIIHLMSGDVASGSTLSFTIIPIHDDGYDIDYEPKYVRAHFSYDGTNDDEVPCKALALVLHKEDILEVVQQDDPNWWQACKVFEEGGVSLPGLVPSMHLQQQREAMVRSYPYCSTEPPKKGLRGLFSKKKKKKIYYQNTPPSNSLGVGDEIPTYEEVIRLDPDPSLCRPIVLVGAPGVGRKALIRKLIDSDPSIYQSVIQFATQGLKPVDMNCREFMFLTREEFERDIEQDRFLEYGEVKGHFYGTAFSTIKQVMESGHVPVLDVHPQALKKLRHSGLKPYVVFVASPRFERLQATRKVGPEKAKKRSSSQHLEPDGGQVYTEVELQHMVKESYLIETQYGHYFDWIIVNDDFQVATDMLKEVTRRLEYEPQWVPASWKNY